MKLSPPWQVPPLTGKFMETCGFEVDEPFQVLPFKLIGRNQHLFVLTHLYNRTGGT